MHDEIAKTQENLQKSENNQENLQKQNSRNNKKTVTKLQNINNICKQICTTSRTSAKSIAKKSICNVNV